MFRERWLLAKLKGVFNVKPALQTLENHTASVSTTHPKQDIPFLTVEEYSAHNFTERPKATTLVIGSRSVLLQSQSTSRQTAKEIEC